MLYSAECSKSDLEEFQASSRELEAELETQLEAAENKNKELAAANSRLAMDVDALRVCVLSYVSLQRPHFSIYTLSAFSWVGSLHEWHVTFCLDASLNSQSVKDFIIFINLIVSCVGLFYDLFT